MVRSRTPNVALGRLRTQQADALRFDQRLVVIEGGFELRGYFGRDAAFDDFVSRAGHFGRLAEE